MHSNSNNDSANTQTWFRQFKFDEVYSDFSDFLFQTGQLLQFDKSILDKIEKDLDRVALKKKAERDEDKAYILNQSLPLDEIAQANVQASPDKVPAAELKTGRPRVCALLVFYFLFIRGYSGGSIRSKKAKNFIFESRSLALLLQDNELHLPSLNSLNENLNAISHETLQYIWDCQLLYAKTHQFDDFEKLFIDSTSVEANTAWPTDSKMMLGLLRSVYQMGQKLDLFGLPNFTLFHCERWLLEMKQLDFEIAQIGGKPGSKRKRGKLYRRFFKRADSMQLHLRKQLELVQLPAGKMLPSDERRLSELLRTMQERLDDVKLQRNQTYQRIKTGKAAPASERKMSINDEDSSYIAKGSREAVIGYKPSLGRSGNGFVTSLLLPDYNAADSEQLFPATQAAIKNTGVIPNIVSVDDGYSSRQGRDNVKALGVSVVSINGSKGKHITAQSDWDNEVYEKARADRSSVESLMFTLKFNYDFGRLGRVGHASAKSEMLEKILAHNQVRMIERSAQIAEQMLEEAA